MNLPDSYAAGLGLKPRVLIAYGAANPRVLHEGLQVKVLQD
jgi:hypothetical protein